MDLEIKRMLRQWTTIESAESAPDANIIQRERKISSSILLMTVQTIVAIEISFPE